MLSQVRIVGSGLIGTSIGLALSSKGVQVQMVDSEFKAQKLASDLIAAVKIEAPELVIFALPTSSLPLVIEAEYQLNPNSTFMDVGSVKSQAIAHVKNSSLPLSSFVPTHPMAGREIGGAYGARADLFLLRSWVVTPTQECAPSSLALVKELIEILGAVLITLPADEHDRAVAHISHLPQITSSLLAASLRNTPSAWLELSGQGVRDTTRIAESDPKLWSEIIFSNRQEIFPLLTSIHSELGAIIELIGDQHGLQKFLESGVEGRALIPGKHGGKARAYTYLPIVIDDKPGQLAAIFNECALIHVNVEDLSIEHSPGQLNALITLALSSTDALTLSAHLSEIGWNVHPILK